MKNSCTQESTRLYQHTHANTASPAALSTKGKLLVHRLTLLQHL